MTRSPRLGRRTGLTLTECVTIIAVLGVLFGLIVPALFTRTCIHHRSSTLRCLSNLQNLGKLATIYAEDTGGGAFPFAAQTNPTAHDSQNLRFQWDPECPPETFVCPEDPSATPATPYSPLTALNTSYTWIAKPTKASTAADTPLASDEPGHHERGVCVVYAGGRAEWVHTAELPADWIPPGLVQSP